MLEIKAYTVYKPKITITRFVKQNYLQLINKFYELELLKFINNRLAGLMKDRSLRIKSG